MIKKLLTLSFILSLSACSSNESNLNQINVEQQVQTNAAKSNQKKNFFGLNVNDGRATFFFTKSSGEQYISSTPTIDISVKRLGVRVEKFNTVNLVMPSKEMRGYTQISNDGNLYIEDYGTSNYYKVGTWSVKGKFKGKGYVDLTGDIDDSIYFQKFDIKIDPSIKEIKADLPLNPMSHKYLYFHTSSDIKPVVKQKADFDLTKFIATK